MNELQSEWIHLRGLTLDLLRACSNDDLRAVVQPGVSPLWKQFRHIGRVHEDYLRAMQSRRMVFDPGAGGYQGGASAQGLAAYLEGLSARHEIAFAAASDRPMIDWFGEAVSPRLHLTRLIAHEALHHGQLLLIWRGLGRTAPQSWASWGEG